MKDEDDSTVKEKSEVVPIYIENNSKKEDLDSFKAVPEHEKPKPIELIRERQLPVWNTWSILHIVF